MRPTRISYGVEVNMSPTTISYGVEGKYEAYQNKLWCGG